VPYAGIRRIERIRWLVAVLVLGAAAGAHAQGRVYVGAAAGLAADLEPAEIDRLGGTTWSGSGSVGVHLTRWLGVEVETTFCGEIHAKPYTYVPKPGRVDGEAHGRNTFVGVLLKTRAGMIEPVAGLAFVRTAIRRHAVFESSGATYFDDTRAGRAIAFAVGLDVNAPVSPRLSIGPTFRVYVIEREALPGFGNTVRPGPVVFRGGIGLRARL
jgi:hypothetical protein